MDIKYVLQKETPRSLVSPDAVSLGLETLLRRAVLQKDCCIVMLSFEASFQTYLGCHRAFLRWSLW